MELQEDIEEDTEHNYKKWIIISLILVVIVTINFVVFKNSSLFSEIEATTAKTFALSTEESSATSTNSTYVPQKIGSVEVISGSTNHIDIKGS
ncbi:hypothetical protein J4444_02635 [Candidatus Woesearchaeota archaeon]|nr:hypothetical protein [Candidatus Woesearchaeota archaeon]